MKENRVYILYGILAIIIIGYIVLLFLSLYLRVGWIANLFKWIGVILVWMTFFSAIIKYAINRVNRKTEDILNKFIKDE